jgi:hypothetical protein
MNYPQGKQSFPHTQSQIPNSIPAKDPTVMFPLGDWQGLDHKALNTGKSTDQWVTGKVLGKYISFFLNTRVSKSVLIEYAGHLKKASFPK